MSAPINPKPERDSRSRAPLIAIVSALVLCGAVVAYLVWHQPKAPAVDMEGAMAANTRGVGQVEFYAYPEAEKEFAEAVRLAPDWTPAKVNRGIAVMNVNTPESKAKAKEIFRDVLAKEPDNKHARYCLGITLFDEGKAAEAYVEFVKVNELDPDDAHTWLRMAATNPRGRESPEAIEQYEQALKRNPYLNEARYGLAMSLRVADIDRTTKLLNEKQALDEADWAALSGIKYGQMGKYADVIGRDPSIAGKQVIGPLPVFEPQANFKVTLAPGAKWATAGDLDPLRKAARERFGGTIVLFDYNRDGRPDIFLVSAVAENGKVRDLLLRNDGGGSFTDVTAEAGLATPRPSLGAAAGDYDNDGFPDLIITGVGEQHLFRNTGKGKFEDVSAATGLDKVTGVCLGCGWVDLDQDSDLDLILCRYAESAESAGLFAGNAQKGGGLVVFENIGEALPVPPNRDFLPLTTKFKREDRLPSAAGECAAVSFVAADFDGDHDIDILVLADNANPILVANDRLMRFSKSTSSWLTEKSHRWNGGLVFGATHGERSDILLARADGPPVFLTVKGALDYAVGNTNSPQLRQAVAVDLDMDGWPDTVGLGADGKPTLLHNQGDGRLENKPAAFGETAPAIALACADLDGDCAPDLLLWTETGLSLRRNAGNGNRAVLINPTGRRVVRSERTNADGIGCRIIAQTGPHWTAAERTTVSAGLGQSLTPTALGMAKADLAEAVRFLWPDGTLQSALGVTLGSIVHVIEDNRANNSCPVLMTWDGEQFVFVTDFLGAGSMGETAFDGSTRPPRPAESVKIEPGKLRAKNGQFVMKIAEPMDELLYLDHVRLQVIDHPSDVVVYPDERFASSDPQPTQELLAFRSRHLPKMATDHRGRDVTKLVLDLDGKCVDEFEVRSWVGFAEDHALTLDFGNLPRTDDKRWFLVLAGWTEYPYAESIYAAERAGVAIQFPTLERLAADGKTWESLGDLGFPAGLPRVMTRELPKFNTTDKCVLRIRTNLQIYWDQIYLAPAVPDGGHVTTLEVSRADLVARGFMQEIYPNGRPPHAYDDTITESVPVTKWKGRLTRLGDVTDLLRAADDRYVLCGPGDEITVRFDASKLPDLQAGWTRSFVLQTWGYCKDAALTTQTGGQVGPLPFRAMKNYPDFGGVKPPVTDADKWNTRPAGGR